MPTRGTNKVFPLMQVIYDAIKMLIRRGEGPPRTGDRRPCVNAAAINVLSTIKITNAMRLRGGDDCWG